MFFQMCAVEINVEMEVLVHLMALGSDVNVKKAGRARDATRDLMVND